MDVEDTRVHLIFSYLDSGKSLSYKSILLSSVHLFLTENRGQLSSSNIRQFLGDDHSVAEYDQMVALVSSNNKLVSKS